MAFNFNWSPLIADTDRAREMLTTALNKSPKPAIIVDDIHVTELNLGSTPPSLEILEIGDLAEDRFRGIFKMVYSGDAFLTLRTRVQANPLNTYLSTKPSFASPQPLAAASGLTIPLAITLSDIRLNGFVILVFSKQKGITLVFRNDPLESLKVSSTFDSIPFVRDYLQSEIEKQLRVLFIDDLPAIIHRLSLRLLVSSEHQPANPDANLNSHPELDRHDSTPEESTIDPLSSPPQGSTEPSDDGDTAFISFEDPTVQYSFSRKNLIRLSALNDSHRTMSLFTPPMRDIVVRAWAGAAEQNRDNHAGPLLGLSGRPPNLTLSSLRGTTTTADSEKASGPGSIHSDPSVPSYVNSASTTGVPSRPMLSSRYSTSHTYSTSGTLSGGNANPRARKRKHRVVNLRKRPDPAEDSTTTSPPSATADGSRPSTPTSTAPPESLSWRTTSSSREDDELVTPPDSPEKKADAERTPHASRIIEKRPVTTDGTIRATRHTDHLLESANNSTALFTSPGPSQVVPSTSEKDMKIPMPPLQPQPSIGSPPLLSPSAFPSATPNTQPGGILEQAWVMKMASEIAKKAEMERRRQQLEAWREEKTGWKREALVEGEQEPPPAYGV